MLNFPLFPARVKLVPGHKPAEKMYKSNGNWKTEKTPPGLCRYLRAIYRVKSELCNKYDGVVCIKD